MRTLTALLALLILASPMTAFAAEKGSEHGHGSATKLVPAKRYSGSAPIDLSHGGLGNNGTFGEPNAEYEQLAEGPYLAPGLSAAPYPYERKEEFVAAVQDRLRFFEEAVVNLRERSSTTWKEAIEHSDQALPKLENLLDQARSTLKQAKSAGSQEWNSAEQGARAAFVALYGTYQTLNSATTK